MPHRTYFSHIKYTSIIILRETEKSRGREGERVRRETERERGKNGKIMYTWTLIIDKGKEYFLKFLVGIFISSSSSKRIIQVYSVPSTLYICMHYMCIFLTIYLCGTAYDEHRTFVCTNPVCMYAHPAYSVIQPVYRTECRCRDSTHAVRIIFIFFCFSCFFKFIFVQDRFDGYAPCMTSVFDAICFPFLGFDSPFSIHIKCWWYWANMSWCTAHMCINIWEKRQMKRKRATMEGKGL